MIFVMVLVVTSCYNTEIQIPEPLIFPIHSLFSNKQE